MFLGLVYQAPASSISSNREFFTTHVYAPVDFAGFNNWVLHGPFLAHTAVSAETAQSRGLNSKTLLVEVTTTL
jgi:hypothetical protein